MAERQVFQRGLSQREAIPRSLQTLEHRHTFTCDYGQIIPNFSEILYPNETLRLNVTNYVRCIPLVTPQFSRVRIFQRFVAVPHRILWQPFEEYINAPNQQVDCEEPYICNFNGILGTHTWHENNSDVVLTELGSPANICFSLSEVQTAFAANNLYEDFSPVGVRTHTVSTSIVNFSRMLGTSSVTAATNYTNSARPLCGYQFFPHELGDYLNAPLFVCSLSKIDTSSRFSAFKFAAYQLAYSYLYRNPNVQVRQDDFYELFHANVFSSSSDYPLYEFPSWYASVSPSSGVNNLAADKVLASNRAQRVYSNPNSVFAFNSSGAFSSSLGDFSSLSDNTSLNLTSWDKVEKFPLKSGANISMLASYYNGTSGIPSYNESRILLTRLRYANWQLDRFTSANPWPQRGDEAKIPVSGGTDGSSTATINIPASLVVATNGTKEAQLALSVPQETTISQGSSLTDANTPFVYNSTDTYPAGRYPLKTRASTAQITVPGTANLYVSPSNFRFAMQLQHIKEMSAATDGRYKSFLSMFYGARSRDSRLDRPEFIGGFVQELQVSEIQQTSSSASEPTPLGTLAGRGVSAKRGMTIRYHADEHTVILGLLHIVPDSEYIGGLNRFDHTIDAYDWVMPQFSGLSEQPIRNSELACLPTNFTSFVNATNDAAFGYEPRFNERRARHSFVTSDFRDTFNMLGSQQYFEPWLITRKFGLQASYKITDGHVVGVDYVVPTLSKEFLSMKSSVDHSNFVVTNPDVMYPFMCDSYFNERLTAIVPSRGVPKM